ncbi:MAG: hypothetical protein BXU00_00930 [Candidatus Nanoclepta minutus]|uniref:HIT domain-containing protein n=1 Tax=Candidatus Nanoclepta minutus TaxID=1940235 RepID=A0A397WNJ8_9ARCH|nr:MAG: hypothetical protein BXU00_00930 [Candidatus Nanoclepta minutus]
MDNLPITLESYEVENRYVIDHELHIHKIEYRRDPLTDVWVRINKNASKKPRKKIREEIEDSPCPFCKENLFKETPKPTDFDRFLSYRSIAFPNKYPYAKYHFVLIPNYEEHITSFSKLSFEDFYNSILLIREIGEYVVSKDPEYRYLLINLNKGFYAGASQEHLHFQVIIEKDLHGTIGNFIRKSEKYFSENKRFLIEDYMETERKIGKRLIKEDKNYTLISPFAPFRNNEIMGMVKSFGMFFMADIKLKEFLKDFHRILIKYEERFENFNMVFLDTSLLKEGKTLPIFRIGQRFRYDMGFLEVYHGEFVVNVPPEETAEEFRRIVHDTSL